MGARFLNKVAVVTGAGRGIGRAVTEKLLHEGARVVACARSGDELETLEKTAPARLIPVQADVTRSHDLARLVELAQRRLRGVDILCPLAGEVFFADFYAETDDEAEYQIGLNSTSAWRTVQAFVPAFNPRATICFLTASVLFEQVSGLEHFAASKAVLSSLAGSLSVLSKQKTLRANSVACSPVATSVWKKTALQQIAKEKQWKWLTLDEVAEAVIYLVSEESRAIRGQEITLVPAE